MFGKKVRQALFVLALVLGAGTIYFHYSEGWSYPDALYFSTMVLTTIGFGDFTPSTLATRMFTVVYALFGIGVVAYVISSVITEAMLKQGKAIKRSYSAIKKVNKYTKSGIRQQSKRRKAKWK